MFFFIFYELYVPINQRLIQSTGCDCRSVLLSYNAKHLSLWLVLKQVKVMIMDISITQSFQLNSIGDVLNNVTLWLWVAIVIYIYIVDAVI